MTNQGTRFFLPIILIIAILAISTASIFIRFAQAGGAPSIVIAAIRLTIASLILAPIAWIRHRPELRTLTRPDLLLGIIAGFFLAVHFATWISSLAYTSVANSVVLVSTSPLWVAILSPVFLNEKLTRVAIIGLVLAFVGGTMIGLSDACSIQNGLHCPELSHALQGNAMPSRTDVLAARTVWGNILALCGALAVSGYLLIGRKVRAKMSLIPYIFLVYGISAIFLLIFMLAAKQSPFGYSTQTYGWIFLLAVIPQLIGHSTFNWLLKYLSATLVAVTTLSEPIGSAVLAYIILKESPLPAVLLGGALILIGIYLTSKQSK